ATQVLADTTVTSTHTTIQLCTGEKIFMVYPHHLRTQRSHTHGPTTLQSPRRLVACCPLREESPHGPRCAPLESEVAPRGRRCDDSPHMRRQGTTRGAPVREVGPAGQRGLPHTRACRPRWSRLLQCF